MRVLRAFPALLLALLVPLCASTAAIETAHLGPVDVRWQSHIEPDAVARARHAAMRTAFAAELPDALVQWSPLTGAPEVVHDPHGPLTVASGWSSAAIVRAFLSTHRDAYGLDQEDLDTLTVLGDSPGGPSGLRLLRIEQRVQGLPVFQSETRFVLDRTGRIWRSLGSLVPGVASTATLDRAALQSPAAALSSLLGTAGFVVPTAAVQTLSADNGLVALNAPVPVVGSASARLVWFPLAPGQLVPAWSLTVFTSTDEDWYAVVDARTGAVLWRRNLREQLSAHPARFGVYVAADGKTPADSPAPQSPNTAQPGGGTQYPGIARTTVNMQSVQNLIASPNGWIDDCPGGADRCDTTTGNNVDACLDRVAPEDVCDASLDLTGRPQGNPDLATRNRDFLGASPRDFSYAPAPQAGNPDSGDPPTDADNQRGAAVQVFYVANWYHDRMFALGFDEASGNFQQINLQGQGGLGSDRVAADVQNGGATGSSTPADGAGPLRLQFGISTSPTPDRDNALDADIVVHELTHGLSHRLVGNSTGLLWDTARSMGEGWSDFYALALLNTTNADDPDGSYVFAGWSTYRTSNLTDNYVYGVRRFPYSTDNARNPLTWADVDAVTADESGGIAPSPLNIGRFGALEAHNAGSIWALTLWEVRARIIADPAGANGDVPSGGETMLRLVTDALKMTPANPSFIDGRDALFAADCATNACANERAIWAGFADRGLGYGAVAPLAALGRYAVSHLSIGTSFELPHLDVINSGVSVIVNDAPLGNGDGRLDPGETATLSIPLTNPWRAAGTLASGVSATLISTTPGVSILDGSAQYPAIAALASGINTDALQIRIPSAIACGQSIEFDLQTLSSLGPRSVHFSLRVGTPGAVGPSVTYTGTPNLPVPINKIDGVSSPLVINDDLDIADLDFRINSLTFPVTGHLSVLLRAPNGYGIDLIWKRGALMTPSQGLGADFTNLVIDDDLPRIAAEDLNQSLSTQEPFTGDWLPAFNSPYWDSYRPTPPSPPAPVASDPIGHLQRLDGSSTRGDWTINIANASATLTGTLASWSLLVQPRVYACTPFVVDGMFANGFEGLVP